MYNTYDDDREIDLVDLLFYLLKKWRGLIIAIVVGAILGAGLSIVKSNKESTIDIDTQAKMDIAYEYRQLYNKQLEYNNNSIIMKLDPNAIYSGTLKYYISAGKNTRVVGEIYTNILNEEKVLNELKDASGFDSDIAYIRELVASWVNEDNDLLSVNLNSDEESGEKHLFVSYRIYSTNQESCENMMQVLRDRIANLEKECVATYGSYEISKVTDTNCLVEDSSILSTQDSNLNSLNNYYTTMQSAENSLTDDEKIAYVEKYSNHVNYEDLKDILLEDVKQSSGKKYFAIGILLMVFIWGAYYVMKYILDSSIKTTSELQSSYHLPIIGRVRIEENNRKRLDKKLQKFQVKVSDAPDTEEYLVQAIKKLNYENLILCGSIENADVSSLMQKVSSACKQVKTGDFISKSAKSLEDAKVATKELLVVQVGKNSCKEIERELESCRLQNIDVVGVITIEKY